MDKTINGAPRVVGVDLSLTATGIAGVGWTEVIGSEPPDNDQDYYARNWRVRQLADRVHEFAHTADLVVIEGPALATHTRGTWDRAHLWWSVVGRLMNIDGALAVVPPSNRAQYATGSGRAGKGAVIEQMTRRFGQVWTDLSGDDNRADAAALCAMGMDRLGHPLAKVPEKHRDALSKILWPAVRGWKVEGL